MNGSRLDRRTMQSCAQQAAMSAYAPYSRFPVGAAVMDHAGRVFAGCNVENASYGLTLCAERNAIAAAVAAGVRKGELQAVWIYTPGERVAQPCGACRQVMHEMMQPGARVFASCAGGQVSEWTVEQILPDPFVLNTA
jgi:cytidine deaminase